MHSKNIPVLTEMRRSITSLFSEYIFPDSFLALSLEQFVKLHAKYLGASLEWGTLERLDTAYRNLNLEPIETLIDKFGLKIKYTDNEPICGYLEFASLEYEAREIKLNLPTLTLMKKQILSSLHMTFPIEEMAILHELIHFIAYSEKIQRYSDGALGELLAYYGVTKYFQLPNYAWIADLTFFYNRKL